MLSKSRERSIVEKLRALPPERIAEVEDFVDFLHHRIERSVVDFSAKLSEAAFAAIWDNPDDADYDRL